MRALPLSVVAGVHALAILGLLQAAPIRQQGAEAAPLLVRFVAPEVPAPRPEPPRSVAAPRLQAPPSLPATRIDPIRIALDAAPAAETRSEFTPAPIAAAPAVRESSATWIEPPRFDLAYLRNPAPAYPPLARRLHEQGRVILRVRVDEDGLARDVRIEASSGSERLDRAALEAVRQWRFAPARRGERTVEGVALVTIAFSLDA